MPWRILVFLVLCALGGCDSLSPKVDNPVFGPPPPRVANIEKAHEQVGWVDDGGPVRGSSREEGVKTASLSDKDAAPKGKFLGNEVVATVNGQPIFASEILDRAAIEPLNSQGVTLLAATKALEAGYVTVDEYRQMQIEAFKKHLKNYIKTRLLAQALTNSLEKEQREKINQALAKMYDEHIEGDKGLKKQLNVNTRAEVDAKLREQGTSLESLKEEFTNQVLASEYMHSKSKKPHMVGRPEMLAYYQAHLDEYNVPEKVRWQLLQISFDKVKGRDKAMEALGGAVDELRSGKKFDDVVRKFSDGPKADLGGTFAWTQPKSVNDAKTAAALGRVEVGAVSDVIETQNSFRLIRIVDRQQAGRRPFEDVQDAIKNKIEDQNQKKDTAELLDDLYRRAVVESPYIKAEEVGIQPDDLNVAPAKGADVPKSTPARGRMSKKRR